MKPALRNIFLLAKLTIKEGIRARFIHGIFFLSALSFVVNFVIAGIFLHDVVKVAVDISLSIISLTGLVVIIFVFLNSMSKDIENHILYLVLSRPISRTQYIVGKYFGSSLLLLALVLIMGILAVISVKSVIMVYSSFIPVNFSWYKFGISIVYIYLGLLLVTSIAVFSFSAFSSPLIGIFVTICFYFIGHSYEAVLNLLTIDFNSSGFSESTAASIIQISSWIVPNLSAFDLKTAAAYGLPISPAYLGWTFSYGFFYSLLLIAAACFIFERRDLK